MRLNLSSLKEVFFDSLIKGNFTRFLSLVVCIQLAGFLGHVLFFAANHYLAGPYIYDKKDTFMDFYHTAYWSLNPGRFTEWGSVYPPLVFLGLRGLMLLSDAQTAVNDGFSLRTVWPEAGLWLLLLYAACVYTAVEYPLRRLFPPWQRLLLAVFFALSPPALFALERGNVIILLCPLVALMLSPNKWLRCLAIALMINIKPYTVLFVLYYVLKGDFKGFISVLTLSFVLFVVSGLVLDQNFPLFLSNLVNFAGTPFNWLPAGLESMDATVNVLDYNAQYRYLFRDTEFSITPDLLVLAALPKYLNFLLIGMAAYLLAVRRKFVSDTDIFLVITSIITNYSVSTGGYVLVMYIPLLGFILSRKDPANIRIFLTLITVFMPLDWIIYRYANSGNSYVYLSGGVHFIHDIRGIGAFLRPVLNLASLYLLAIQLFRTPYRTAMQADMLPQT